MVDTLSWGGSAERRVGSSPILGTKLLAHSSRSCEIPNLEVKGAIPEGPANFCKQENRVGVSPGQLCAVMHTCRIRCLGASPKIVSGDKSI